MANSKQAEKRNRQREKARLRNRRVLGSMRTSLTKARKAVDEGAPEAKAAVGDAVSRIDKAVAKGALKRETASRLISRLARRGA